jgi:hypothetical protein
VTKREPTSESSASPTSFRKTFRRQSEIRRHEVLRRTGRGLPEARNAYSRQPVVATAGPILRRRRTAHLSTGLRSTGDLWHPDGALRAHFAPSLSHRARPTGGAFFVERIARIRGFPRRLTKDFLRIRFCALHRRRARRGTPVVAMPAYMNNRGRNFGGVLNGAVFPLATSYRRPCDSRAASASGS